MFPWQLLAAVSILTTCGARGGKKKPFLSYHHKSKHVEFTNLHWDNVKQGRGAVMLRASIIVVYAATLTDIKS